MAEWQLHQSEVVIDSNQRPDAPNNDYKTAAVDKVIADYGQAFVINHPASEAMLDIIGLDRELRETTILERDGNAKYTGMWNRDNRHGKGKQVMPSGEVYEGYWQHDKKHGYGRIIYYNGESYIGEWIRDKKQGRGDYKHINGTEYSGDWFEDKQHGQGEGKWADGSKYVGSYIDGIKQG